MTELWRGANMMFGGSFDPVHLGHLVVAEAAQAQCQPRRFVWMPAAQAPLKTQAFLSSTQRVALLNSVIDGREDEQVSQLELDRGGTSFTVDTVLALHAQDPGQRWQLLMGWDSFSSLPRWHRISELVALPWLQFVVAPRAGGQAEEFAARCATWQTMLPALDAHLLEMAEIPISSTEVREALAAKDHAQLREYLPTVVWQQFEAEFLN